MTSPVAWHRRQAPALAKTAPAGGELRVVMLDLLSFVPYYTGHLCAALEQAGGVQVMLASATYQHDPAFFRRQGIRNHPGLLDLTSKFPEMPRALRRTLKLLEYLANLAAITIRMAISPPDVLHVQFLPLASHGFPLESWILRVLRALGIKVVHTVHNVLPQDTGERYREPHRRLYRTADALICHDAGSVVRLAKEFAVPPERMHLIPHGTFFEDSPASGARQKLGYGPDECVVLWQGIMRPYKGVPFLLRAWREVCARNSSAILVIAGTGEETLLRAVRTQVAELEIEQRVRLDLRFVSVNELQDLYSAADVLVYPYSEITTSGALMTGIAHGKAVVATDLPAFRDLIHDGVTGLLVRYGDVANLAFGLLRLINDSPFRRKLGAHLLESHQQAPRWSEIAERTCACYRAVLKTAPPWNGAPVKT